MVNNKLERTCIHYCGNLRQKHKKQRRHDYKNNKDVWDLPKCAVACCSKHCQNKPSMDFSKPVRENTYDKVPTLKSELVKYSKNGKIGGKTFLRNCGNQVGRCAEPHAAKCCMLKISNTAIKDLLFSVALDIKASEPMSPCAICLKVFPTIK